MKLSAGDKDLDSCGADCCRSLVTGELAETSEMSEKVRRLLGKDLQLFTVVEVSQFLGIGRSKVYELMYKGELKSVKIGGSRRIRYSDLGEYVRYLDDAS
jgi:excisionase family DNA binding protein